MANPFSGIISADIKNLYNNMIDALIEEEALSRIVYFVYDDNTINSCSNCIVDSNSGLSTGVYNGTGPIPFGTGQICPYCNGQGSIEEEAALEENIMAVLWRTKDFQYFGKAIANPDLYIQTISHTSLMPKIKAAKYITVQLTFMDDNTFDRDFDPEDNKSTRLMTHKFIREGEPQPAGFGQDRYLFTFWKKVS